jgi:IS605 OrfB family transposase
MLVLEFKVYAKPNQFQAIDEAIRICQFIRNKSIRLWMDGGAKSWFELSKYCAIWAKEFDFANKLARCVITSNDVVVYEDLRVSNMAKNHCLAKSISDASWYQFRVFLEYFGKVFGRITIAVNPAYTSQECHSCGTIVQKSLSTRTHICQCGCEIDRDRNAAINILNRGISTAGHVGTSILEIVNA